MPSPAPSSSSMDLPTSWLHREPSAWGELASWRAPDEGQALLIDGHASEDGQTWSDPPFPAKRLDVTIAVLDVELARQAYALASRFLASASVRQACLEQESEQVCAFWQINNEKGVVLVGDADGRIAQEEFDKVLHRLHVPFASKGLVGQYRHFDGTLDDQIDPAFHAALADLVAHKATPATRRRC